MVACDGIWDCVSNEECMKRCHDQMTELKVSKDNISQVVESLFE